jgi:hypothetical protein
MRLLLVSIKWPTPYLLVTTSQIRKRDLDLVPMTQRQFQEMLDFGLEQLLEQQIDLRTCLVLEHMILKQAKTLLPMGKQYVDLDQENDLLSLISTQPQVPAPMIQI